MHSLIERKLGIEELPQMIKKNSKDKICVWTRNHGSNMSQSNIEIRSAPDKLTETIRNKISRKSNKMKPENIP